MAGGIGSRFWPVSKTECPKQFLDILGTGKSFIRSTFERFLPIVPPQNFLVVTNAMYKDLVLQHIPELTESQVLCEPIIVGGVWVILHKSRLDGFIYLGTEFVHAADADLFGAVLGAPDGQRCAPITRAREVPVHQIFEPVAETSAAVRMSEKLEQ